MPAKKKKAKKKKAAKKPADPTTREYILYTYDEEGVAYLLSVKIDVKKIPIKRQSNGKIMGEILERIRDAVEEWSYQLPGIVKRVFIKDLIGEITDVALLDSLRNRGILDLNLSMLDPGSSDFYIDRLLWQRKK